MNESLDSRQMKAFVVLAQTGSYTETAKRLYVTHSAISHSMKALEEQLGCRLFYKLGKKITVTEAGEAFLHHATRALEEMRQAHVALAQFKNWGTRRLRLAVDAMCLTDRLNAVLVKLHEKMPNVSLEVEFCKAGESVKLLQNNQVDIVFTEQTIAQEGLEFIPLLADRSQFVVSHRHPLLNQSAVTRDQVGQHPCILLRDAGYTRRQLEHSLSRRGFWLNVVAEIESVDMVKHLVKETQAISFLPNWIVAEELKCQTLRALALPYKPLERRWGMMHLPEHPLNHVEATFLKLCREALKKPAQI